MAIEVVPEQEGDENVPPSEPGPSFFRLEAWRDQARCRGVGHEIFFSSDRFDQLTALAYCRGCPVRRQCAVSATVHQEQGTWGGTTEEERAASSEPLAG